MTNTIWEFDIAISFAGEDRKIAQALAYGLKNQGLKVFYDDDEQANLLGECLTEYLVDIYKNKAQYCIILISSHYVEKRWTRHEWKAAQARAFEQFDDAYILPIRLDDTELLGLLPTIGFLDFKSIGLNRTLTILYDRMAKDINLNTVFRKAYHLFSLQQFEECEALLSNPKYSSDIEQKPAALRLLADIHIRSNRYSDALSVLNKAHKINSEDFETNFLMAICLFRTRAVSKSVT